MNPQKPSLDSIFTPQIMSGKPKPSLQEIFSHKPQLPPTPIDTDAVSFNKPPTDNAQSFTAPFTVNTNNFGFKDIPKGVGATLGNAVMAPVTAAFQASRIPGQIKDTFTQNGGEGAYGKYTEGVDSIMEGINKAIFDPVASSLSTIGNTGLGALQSGIKGLTGHDMGDEKARNALNNTSQNIEDTLSGVAKFGIEQPTTAALAAQQAYSSLTKSPTNPNPDLIHEVGGGVIDKAKSVTEPILNKIKTSANNLANSLEQESMRLTPTQKAKLNTRLNEISQFNIDNGIKGSPQTRLAKIDDIVNRYDSTLDNYLKTEVPDNVVDTQSLTDRLNNLKIKYSASDMADLEGAAKQIDSAVNRLGSYGDSVPTARLNNLKSSYYKQSYGNQIGSGLTNEVQGDIARVFKEAIEENVKDAAPINGQSIADFNHDYGNAIVSQKILRAAIGKPQLGPIARLASKGVGIAAGSVAGVPGEIVGGLYGDRVAGLLAGTHARSILSDLLSGEEPYLPENTTNTAQAMNSNSPMNPSSNIGSNNIIPPNPSTSDLGSQGSIESILEKGTGWQPGMKAQFDTALHVGDAAKVKALLPQVPAEYIQRFSNEIQNLFSKGNDGASALLAMRTSRPKGTGLQGQFEPRYIPGDNNSFSFGTADTTIPDFLDRFNSPTDDLPDNLPKDYKIEKILSGVDKGTFNDIANKEQYPVIVVPEGKGESKLFTVRDNGELYSWVDAKPTGKKVKPNPDGSYSSGKNVYKTVTGDTNTLYPTVTTNLKGKETTFYLNKGELYTWDKNEPTGIKVKINADGTYTDGKTNYGKIEFKHKDEGDVNIISRITEDHSYREGDNIYNEKIVPQDVSPEDRKIIDNYLKKYGKVGPPKKVSHMGDSPNIDDVYFGDKYERNQIVPKSQLDIVMAGFKEIASEIKDKKLRDKINIILGR